MRSVKLIINLLLIVSLFLTAPLTLADIDQQIAQILQSSPKNNLAARIDYFSAALLNQPYQLEPLGEGAIGEFNQEPLYRLDGFDCQTFVETVMALSLAHNLTEFKALINKIRYANGTISFTTRNHFPSADWLPHNRANGFINDITASIAGKQTLTARAYINRQEWYEDLTRERIKIPGLSSDQIQLKLTQLHAHRENASNTWASINYIPRRKLLINGKIDKKLAAQIPEGSIILIVNHTPTRRLLGTDMNVTHMGFAIWRGDQLYFRAASTVLKRITDIAFIAYLLENRSKIGISIWRIKPI